MSGATGGVAPAGRPRGARPRLVLSALALAALLGGPLAPPAGAQQPPERAPAELQQDVLLSAEEVIYDRELGLVTARGKVELVQGQRILLADTVSYNQKADVVTASGNVSLLEPTGEVLFADYVELTGDLKEGLIRDIGLLLTDNSRLAARGGRRIAGVRKEFERVVFSPCRLCPEDPTRPPLWQIKAAKVVHDEVAKDIEYTDATMEMFGLPVFYTPYLSHPDPTVERRSGFLAPTIGHSSDLGFILGVPYHYVVSPSADVTLEPIVYSGEGGVLRGEYRQRWGNGEVKFTGSGAYLEESDGDGLGPRGHIDAFGLFSLDETWRAGFDAERTSNRTYLRRYNLDDREVLTSRLFAEGFRGRNYAAVNAYAFQDLRASHDSDLTPLVAPFAEYSFVGEPGAFGGRPFMDASLLSLSRDIGADSNRLAVETGWSLPYIGPLGDVTTLTASVLGGAYHVNDVTDPEEPAELQDGATGRVLPQVQLDWRYPLVRRGANYSQFVEPRVAVVAAPAGHNPGDIPNEDSQGFEFGYSNLFSRNRFAGIDRVSSGSRVDYGVTMSVLGDRGGRSAFSIGQSYRLAGGNPYPEGSGFDDDVSDIVGRLIVSPRPWLDLLYRFRLDKETLEPARSEIGGRVGSNRLSVSADYVMIEEHADTRELGDREQIAFGASSQLTENWRINGYVVRDLSGGDEDMRALGGSLVYQDECILVILDYRRSFTRDADIEPHDSVTLRLGFKYLGDVRVAQ